jgi:hypothetical protein
MKKIKRPALESTGLLRIYLPNSTLAFFIELEVLYPYK